MNMIRDQMHKFWEQMKNEIPNPEKQNIKTVDSIRTQESSENLKPQVKPRTKLLKSTIETHSKPQPIITVAKKENPQKPLENQSSKEIQQTSDKKEDVPKKKDSILEIQAPKFSQVVSSSGSESDKISNISKDDIIIPKEKELQKSRKK